MSERKEVAIIPKGSYVSIMGCRITLVEDTKVEGNQTDIDYILKEQKDFNNGVGVVGKSCTPRAPSGKSGGVIDGSKNTEWML